MSSSTGTRATTTAYRTCVCWAAPAGSTGASTPTRCSGTSSTPEAPSSGTPTTPYPGQLFVVVPWIYLHNTHSAKVDFIKCKVFFRKTRANQSNTRVFQSSSVVCSLCILMHCVMKNCGFGSLSVMRGNPSSSLYYPARTGTPPQTTGGDTFEQKTSVSTSGKVSKITRVLEYQNHRKATIRPKRQFIPNSKKRQFVPSDNSSQATIRPILKRRKFVPIIKSCNLSSN